MVPVLSRSREFSLFLDGTGTGTGKNWSRKKVPVPVPKKIWSQKKVLVPVPEKLVLEKVPVPVPEKLVPEKSTGPGTGRNWSLKKNHGDKMCLLAPKKVLVPVPETNLGTVTLCSLELLLTDF